ncbi:hypothetical protein ABW21_db0209026 [Orbilia brochopaga]|nr:hypothetical protein ABW21_db0209026 [Drechslerella brochopaga]
MEKCWFILRHTHYPPPVDRVGPIQLGHIIPNFKSLDQVINAESGPLEFSRGMTSFKTTQGNFTWDSSSSSNADVSVSTLVPVDASGLVSAGGQMGFALKRSIKNFWAFDKVEREIIQPTIRYIENSLHGEEVERYILERKGLAGRWEVFMITGLAIARGAKGSEQLGEGKAVHGGPNVGLAAILNVGADVSLEREKISSSSFEAATDFVWAIRLMRIYKSVFRSGWRYETHTGLSCPSFDDKPPRTGSSRGSSCQGDADNSDLDQESLYDTPVTEDMVTDTDTGFDRFGGEDIDDLLLDGGVEEESVLRDGDEMFVFPC